MPDQKLLKAVLRFDIEKQAAKTAEAELNTLIKEFQTLQAESRKFETVVAAALKKGLDTKAARSGLDELEQKMTKVGLAVRQQIAENADRSFRKIEERIQRIGRMGSDVQMLGMSFREVSQSIMGPFDDAIRGYTQNMGIADTTSRKWVIANKQVEQAQMRVGAVAANQLLPLMQKGAELAGKVADFVESHPDLIKAVLAIGVGTGGLATASMGIANVMQGVSSTAMALKGLGLIGGAGGAAGGAAAAGGVSAAAGTAIGAGILVLAPVIGVAIGEAIVETTGIGEKGGLETRWLRTKQIAGGATAAGTSAIADLFEKIGNPEVANRIRGNTVEYLKFMGLVTKEGELVQPPGAAAGGKAAPPLQIPESAVKSWISFKRDVEQSEIQYNKQRENMVVNTLRTINESEANYGKQRAKQIKDFEQGRTEEQTEFDFGQGRQRRDFLASLSKEEEQYGSQREEQIAKFQQDESRSAADHQRELARMARDHQYTMEDAIASRDAIAAFREQRSYENQVGDSNENFAVQSAQRNEDFAQQLQDTKDSFEAQRDERLKQYDLQKADQLEDYNKRRDLTKLHFDQQQTEQDTEHKADIERIKANAKVELDQLETSYLDQQRLRNDAFKEQLDDLAIFLGDESKMRVAYMEQAKKELEALYKGETVLPTGVPASKAATTAGYAATPGYEGSRREQINARAQAAFGGSALSNMNPQSVKEAFEGGRGGGVNLSMNYTFAGSTGAGDREWFQRVAYEQAHRALADVLKEIK